MADKKDDDGRDAFVAAANDPRVSHLTVQFHVSKSRMMNLPWDEFLSELDDQMDALKGSVVQVAKLVRGEVEH